MKKTLFALLFVSTTLWAQEPQLMFEGTKESCEEAVESCQGNETCIEQLAKQGCEVEPKISPEILEQFQKFSQ